MIDKVHYDIITPRLINMLHKVKTTMNFYFDKLRGKKTSIVKCWNKRLYIFTYVIIHE